MTPPSKHIDLLNAVKDLLVEFANEQGIDLEADFGTVDEFKRFTIAFTFRQLVGMGIEVKDAYDMVLGEGQYQALIEKTLPPV